MSDINIICIVGRLTRDPEANESRCKFSIANNYYMKDRDPKETVNFFDCVAFGRIGETCAKYLSKGARIAIDGELRHNRWKDKDGKDRSGVSIIVNRVQMLDKKEEGAKMSKQIIEESADEVPF